MSRNIVIVGSGQAGVSVAFKLRNLGFDGNITLIGDEPDLPYHRPPLSKKFIAGDTDADRLHLKQESLYDSQRIKLLLGSRAVRVHRGEKQVGLADGRMLDYDFLVLATGATARRMPAEQGGNAQNIHTLRTLADARQLRAAFLADRKLLVVGGGYIGLETAAVARSIGMQVTLIERDSRILGRVASAETASYFRVLHQDMGVRVLEGMELDRFECIGLQAVAARLADSTVIDVDVVVVGIGVVPEIDLARQAGLQVGNGIVVDRTGRTTDSSIYALGDCACFPHHDHHIRLESVQNAVDMAGIVARSMLGEDVEYASLPWFWSDQYSTKLQIAGLNIGYTCVAVRRPGDSGVSIWYYKNDRFIAVDAINDAKAFMTAKRWLNAGYSPVFNEIADGSIPLNAVTVVETN